MITGDGSGSPAASQIGSNHLEAFPEIDIREKHLKYLKSDCERVDFLVQLQDQVLELQLKSNHSQVFFKDFAKTSQILSRYFFKGTSRNSFCWHSIRWSSWTIINGSQQLWICCKELHLSCDRLLAAFDSMCFIQHLLLHYFFYHFKYIRFS